MPDGGKIQITKARAACTALSPAAGLVPSGGRRLAARLAARPAGVPPPHCPPGWTSMFPRASRPSTGSRVAEPDRSLQSSRHIRQRWRGRHRSALQVGVRACGRLPGRATRLAGGRVPGPSRHLHNPLHPGPERRGIEAAAVARHSASPLRCLPGCVPRRLKPDHSWETDGEQLHSFIEDGLAKHLKVQASPHKPHPLLRHAPAVCAGEGAGRGAAGREGGGVGEAWWSHAAGPQPGRQANQSARGLPHPLPQVDLEPDAQTIYGPDPT